LAGIALESSKVKGKTGVERLFKYFGQPFRLFAGFIAKLYTGSLENSVNKVYIYLEIFEKG
jgi:hypothetical protein